MCIRDSPSSVPSSVLSTVCSSVVSPVPWPAPCFVLPHAGAPLGNASARCPAGLGGPPAPGR
eukprot:4476356-Alexandrium_andersonii.AAC.1